MILKKTPINTENGKIDKMIFKDSFMVSIQIKGVIPNTLNYKQLIQIHTLVLNYKKWGKSLSHGLKFSNL